MCCLQRRRRRRLLDLIISPPPVHAKNNDGLVVIADGEHPVYFPILVGGVPFRRQQHVEVNGIRMERRCGDAIAMGAGDRAMAVREIISIESRT